MPDNTRARKLTGAQQQFVLRCLALGFGYQEIVDFVKDEFDAAITRQNVKYYADNYAERIGELAEEIREDIDQIPFAKKITRVAYLDRAARKHFKRQRWGEFRATLRQIAEETGGLLQKVEHTGKGGGPIETKQVQDLTTYTDDELKQMRAIHEAANARRDQPGTS